MDDSILLAMKNMCVWYMPDKPVLSDFSIKLGINEVVGLIGLNGAGKTTFIKAVSGLMDSLRVEEIAFMGRVFMGEHSARKFFHKTLQGNASLFRNNEFKRERYTVFAEDRSFPYFTFHEYLSYAASSYGRELPDVSELIQGFHFEDYTDVLLKELSTGNLKKVYLITAFALRPKLLLLDEPVNGLDFQSTEFLYRQINSYRQYGTVLFSSHILESICLTSDRVLVLEQGRIKRSFIGQEIEAGRIRETLAEGEE
ncbi:MAG: ABC transporter ATP-binding protein [Eubacterium sp.]|nr:ABC transporter ATP-binding protein [Eubacterium sp.]